MIEIKKYYCKKCSRYHYRGKIYKEHKLYKKKKSNSDSYSRSRIIDFNFKELRPIAQRQVLRLIMKMKATDKKEMYIEHLNRVIQHENKGH